MTGRQRWSATVPLNSREGSPAIGPDGTVYVETNRGNNVVSTLSALDPLTGQSKWQIQCPNAVAGSPAVAPDGTIYVSGYSDSQLDTSVIALTPGRSQKWIHTNPVGPHDDLETNVSIGPDGTVYVTGKQNLYALSALNGSVLWTAPLPETALVSQTPVVGPDGSLYVLQDDFLSS